MSEPTSQAVEDPPSRAGLGRLVAISAAAIGVIYGYDTGIVAGALLFLPDDFDLSTAETSSVVTAVAIGMIVGALLAGKMTDAFGRKITMVAIAAGYVVFAALSAVAQNLVWLDGSRLGLGITIGLSTVAAPVFIAESSPPKIRGALLVCYQVATVAGIMLAYLVSYGLAALEAWRWMLGISAIPAAVVGVMLLRLPDTPRWYMMQGRRADAERTLRRIDPAVDIEHELVDIEQALNIETSGRLSETLREMFRPPYLRASVFVITLGFLVQITGINAVIYFTPLIFTEMGLTGNVALLLVPALIQFVALLATVGAIMLVDRIGRRKVLMIGIGAMIAANVLLAAVFATDLGGAATGLAFAGVLLFTCGFDFGFGAMVWVYASESFPGRLRSTGASFMLTADLLANALIAQFFLGVLGRIGGVATFTGFGVLAVLSLVFVYALAPETKGRSLDSIRQYWENGGRWDARDES